MAVASQRHSKQNILTNDFVSKSSIGTDYSYKHERLFINTFFVYVFLILVPAYGLVFYFFTFQYIPFFIYGILTMLGATVGVHRYYSHRTFKAKLPLQILMLFLFTASGQFSVFWWAREHRLHHRYADTDADTHNAKRGFFFSHVGWVMSVKHPYVFEFGKKTDVSDLLADPLVMFQRKYYIYLFLLTGIVIPTCLPVYLWNMSWFDAIICNLTRYGVMTNAILLINSAGHLYGIRPYDKNLQPVESWFVSLVTLGEGWHNYHHTFPWDYKASEKDVAFNLSTTVINFLHSIGQAYDLKTASSEMVEKRILNTGDGTHHILGDDESRAAVTAVGPLHPLNPSYTTTKKAPNTDVRAESSPHAY